MNISASAQVLVFFAMVLCGIMCGIVFDLFRGIRYRRKTSGGVVALQDIIFWIAELTLVYAVIFTLNYAYVRVFELVALIIGSALYFMTISDFVVALVSRLTDILARLIVILTKPFYRAFLLGQKIAVCLKGKLMLQYSNVLGKITRKSSLILSNLTEKIKKLNKLPKKAKK